MLRSAGLVVCRAMRLVTGASLLASMGLHLVLDLVRMPEHERDHLIDELAGFNDV